MSCNLATAARIALFLLAASALGGCAFGGPADTVADRGMAIQPAPQNARAEILSFLRTYLNDPRGIRDAGIAEPMPRDVNGKQRYVACVRYNARDTSGAYGGTRERGALFIDGRFDRIIEKPEDLCEGVRYAPFPELEKLTR